MALDSFGEEMSKTQLLKDTYIDYHRLKVINWNCLLLSACILIICMQQQTVDCSNFFKTKFYISLLLHFMIHLVKYKSISTEKKFLENIRDKMSNTNESMII